MIVGIVAEYNPFHNGHKLQIDYAKNNLKANAIVVAMSGSFTQRGQIACFNKYVRSEAALKCGADIIFEIPTIFSTASAREFAAASVQLLAASNIVDTILFGAESDNIELFKKSAKKLVELESNGVLDSSINNGMSQGLSYASARARALEEYLPKEIFSTPNNILGLEYCRYIYAKNINMDIAILKREGNNYNSTSLSGEISSASAIRAAAESTGKFHAIPDEALNIYSCNPFISADDVSLLLHYKLLLDDDYEKYMDCSAELADRIRNNLDEYISFNQFCDLLKTKNIAYSRISRVLCHILLGITEDDFNVAKANGYISYLRMLGFSETGRGLLSQIKSKNPIPLLSGPGSTISRFDILSSDIVRSIETSKSKAALKTEYTRQFNLKNIQNQGITE